MKTITEFVPKAQPESSQTRSSGRESALTNSAAASTAQPAQPSANNSPSPWGEGRGEGDGGRLTATRKSQIANLKSKIAFTLIELLVVIAIIAILAAILLPTLSAAMTHAKKTQAKLAISQIANAIEQYQSQYSRMPVPTGIQQCGSNYVTYGGTYTSAVTTPTSANQFPPAPGNGWTTGGGYAGYGSWRGGLYVTSNSDVMAILLDLTNYPNSTQFTINTNYQKNPMRTVFLSGSYTADTNSPGIGTDLNYRDPWGNPYIITMDLNDDNNTADPFYSQVAISASTGNAKDPGLFGLTYEAADDYYHFHGNVMVWSMGPNGPYNHSPSSFIFPTGVYRTGKGLAMDPSNRNHILSWAQ